MKKVIQLREDINKLESKKTIQRINGTRELFENIHQ